MRVMLGGCTRSTAASSPSVMGPSRSMLASAACVDAVSSSPVAAACWRMRRDSRATASRRCEASSVISAVSCTRVAVDRGLMPNSLALLISLANEQLQSGRPGWRRSAEQDELAGHLAPCERGEAVVDLVERHRGADQGVELQPAGQVPVDVARDVDPEPVRTHVGPLEPLAAEQL